MIRLPHCGSDCSSHASELSYAAMLRSLLCALIALACSSAYAAESKPLDLSKLPPAATRTVPFAEIQPLLERSCVSCHGAEKQKGGLRLDIRSAALQGGDSGPAFKSGKSAESKLIHLVAALDPEEVMPPKGDKLTATEIGL